MLRALTIFLLCALALAAIIGAIGISSCNEPPKENRESTEANQANKYDCTTPYATFKVGLYESWRLTHEYHEEVIAVGTVFIAIFTIILGTFTVNLAGATQELVRETRQTGERQLRAYISISPKLSLNWKNPGNKIGVSFDIKNHGKTPGFEILYDYSMLILDSPLPSNFVWPVPDKQFDQNNTLFPGAEVPVRILFDRDITQAERTAIEAGTKRFHMRGVMHYRDAFREPRTTKFSFSFGGPDFAQSFRDPKVKWHWEEGHTHNDAT